MTHGSLFSGIGGFDLAAEWMGWENKFHCEWNPFGQKVLKHYWPNAESFNDITKTDFTTYANRIDILTGGFPCQPYSVAGKRLGKEDDRHLWPHMYRAIQEIKPRWIVGENVRGLISWDGGLVFHEVQVDLENAGYQVQPFLLPACGVNAPHQRYRIWFVAYSDNRRIEDLQRKWQQSKNQSSTTPNSSNSQNVAYSDNKGRGSRLGKVQKENGKISERDYNAEFSNSNKPINGWESFPTVSPICNGDDGISSRLDGITFSKWRQESIKAGGNAIVPQVALQIFKAVQMFEDENRNP